jgi:catechol 2,3-dioxygenase-like lactoylglutathione lyase family enzyme
MAVTMVDVRTPPPAGALGLVQAYSHVVLEVADLDRARGFYANVLRLSGDAARLEVGEQALILAQQATPRTLPESGTHVGLRFAQPDLAAILGRLSAAGVAIHTHHEDRPSERTQNRYCLDPDGNRLQLIQADSAGIDHVAVETHDLEWAEAFYTHVLGGVVESRVGWCMGDFERALNWGNGEDDCAPGTRRWDKRYTSIEGQARVPRPNPHFFVAFVPGVVLGVYLATEHRQEPPPDQFVGTPRVAFRVGRGRFRELQQRLGEVRLRCMRESEFGGPYVREGDSLFVRDPGGVFLELIGT